MAKETAKENTSRIFPVATSLIRGIYERGGTRPDPEHARALCNAYKEDANKIEFEAAAHLVLTKKWSSVVSMQGQAKLDHFAEPDLWPEDIREIACRAYAIKLVDGSKKHSCLYDMTDEQLKQVEAEFDDQIEDLTNAKADVDKIRQLRKKLRVPSKRALSEFMTLRTLATPAPRPTRKAKLLEPA